MSHFYLRSGDTQPAIQATLRDLLSPIDLTNASAIAFTMVSLAGVRVIDRAVASFVDRANGVVKYQWTANDTATAGTFLCSWTIYWDAGNTEPQTVPTVEDDYITINAAV